MKTFLAVVGALSLLAALNSAITKHGHLRQNVDCQLVSPCPLVLADGTRVKDPDPEWLDSGIVTSPSAGQVLSDTGPVSGPVAFQGCVSLYASVAATFDFQQRDAANTSTEHVQRLSVTAGNTEEFCWHDDTPFLLDDGERLRIISVGALTLGTVSTTLMVH